MTMPSPTFQPLVLLLLPRLDVAQRLQSLIRASPFASLAIPLLLIVGLANADVFDQFARQGRALLADAMIKDAQIRQCACDEQHECVDEMKSQGLACVGHCWGKFEALRKCFNRADDILDDLFSCVEQNVDACLEQRNEKQLIQRVNITELFRLGVERVERTKQQLTRSMTGPIRKIIDTASLFGLCVKDCFLAKNSDGFCFDKKHCQPLLAERKTRKSLRICTRAIDWKKEVGELCDCSVKAGLRDLQQYCPMLRLIGGGGIPHRNMSSGNSDATLHPSEDNLLHSTHLPTKS